MSDLFVPLPIERQIVLTDGCVDAEVPGYSNKSPRTFAGGHKSPFYTDCRKIQRSPALRRMIASAIIESMHLNGFDPQVVAGIQNAGIPHSILVADRLDLPHASIRKAEKDHGVGGMIEGEDVKNKRVLIIEDVVSTAGSLLRGVQSIRAAGGKVIGMVFFMTYNLDRAYDQMLESRAPFAELFGIAELLRAMERKGKLSQEEILDVLEWQVDPTAWYEDWKAKRTA